jgi:Thioredoxin reductase
VAIAKRETCDLLIVGSGPAGMSAAINGASEGLKVCMIDGNTWLGGQARESNAIENYPGFPEGIKGAELMDRFTSQAVKFDTRIYCPIRAAKIERDEKAKSILVTSEDYTQFEAKTVLLSVGLAYRRHEAVDIGLFMGRGVYYGLPQGSFRHKSKCKIVVVGGANSAGQAVLKLAENPNAHITMLIRKAITDQMSKYLIDRIRLLPNVEVREGRSVAKVQGKDTLASAILDDGNALPCTNMYVFIGAQPKTLWLEDRIQLDARNFIRTWHDVDRLPINGMIPEPLPYETSMRGVFAAGDVRAGSVKRIAAAIGEGGAALQMIHNRLASL